MIDMQELAWFTLGVSASGMALIIGMVIIRVVRKW